MHPYQNIIVCVSGGRAYTNTVKIYQVLDELHVARNIAMLVEGGCPVGDGGADERARQWAKSREVNCYSIPPKSRRYGWPACGPARNEEMASCKPNVWVIFPGGRGTASARAWAMKCGAEIIEVKL